MKIINFFAIALLGVAAAIAAVAVLSTPATAQAPGGGGDSDDYPWDTDNLRIGSTYSAKSFNIPFHNYGGYSGVAACQKNVADGFFQTDNSVVNDFPVLVSSGSGDSVTWSVAAGSAGNDAGCDTFVAQQDRLAAQVAAGLTYVLSEDGKVGVVGGAAFTTGRSVSDLNYVTWTAKGSPDYTIVGTHGATKDSRYLRRADGIYNNRRLAITPYSAGDTITVPSGASTGNFGAAWHASRSDQLVGGVYYDYYKVSLYPSLARHLTKTKSDDLCIGDFHPRGEDSYQRIGGNTGRSLTGLSHAAGRTADRFWCRSDVRYERRFKAEHHTGVTEAQRHPQARNMAAGTVFSAYGRLGCYYTSIGAQGITGTTASKCDYHFPLPKCDPNPGNGSDSDWRNYTNREIQSSRLYGKIFTKADGDPCATQCTHNGAKRDMTSAEISEYIKDNPLFVPNTDGTTPCVKSDGPPQQAGFTADPCVTADLEIYENRTVGSAAEPGVPASDRTLAVAVGRTAWDLDITSPHHNTASPPRDVASTPSDATGCADGSEGRADHSSDAGSAVRKNTAAGVDLTLPASSVAAKSTHPPHSKGFDSAGTDYTGAVKNIAHRYASNVAENTCAAKRAEAEMVLSEMKARRLEFQRYIDLYESQLDSAIGVFSSYSADIRTGPSSGANSLGLKIRQHNAEETRRAGYVALRKAHLDKLKLALTDAESAYQTASSQSVTALPNSGCVAAYDTKISNLRTSQKNAETAFPTTISSRNGISTVKNHLRNFNQQGGPNLNVGRITISGTPTSPLRRPTSPSWTAGATSSTTTYHCNTGGETGFSLTSDNKCTKTVSSTSYVYSSPTETEEEGETVYTCPAGTTPIKIVFGITVCRKSVTTSSIETGTVRTTITYSWIETYSSTRSGTISGSYTDPTTTPATTYTKSVGYERIFTGRRACSYATGHNSSPTTCGTPTHRTPTGRTPAQAKALVEGTKPVATSTPGFSPPSKPADHAKILSISLLGKYHPQHPDRANLKAASAADRDTAANNLGTLSAGNITTAATGATYTPQNIARVYVPTTWGATGTPAATRRSDLQTETNDYKTAYTGAYNTAYSTALADMGTTATTTTWNNFDWRYHNPSLAWVNYQEDPATTYSASTATPRDGTGCDLVSVASDGTVSVEATRLDYETSSYGKGSVYSTRTDAQRTCKIRRTRTPELLLEYQPSVPSGTDTSKTATFWHVDYQPTPAAERFKLYDEAEVFAVEVSLADRAPVLCYQPGEALVAHVGARGIDAVNKAVFRNASGFRGGNKKHCYRPPSLEQLGSPPLPLPRPKPQPAFAFFDDTAHSAMASVNVVWQQPSTKIVPKLGSTDDLKMMANTVALVASSPVAYVDATRTSSFYGTYYTFPTDTSTESPSGWDITGHPTLTLASTFEQHQVQAKDTAAKTPATHTMVFKFIDCMFGIEDVAFVDNIASPYALLSDENGVVPAGWKQTYDSDPHNSPTWYYPAFSTYEGALRLDGRRDSNGDPITYGRNTQHRQYQLWCHQVANPKTGKARHIFADLLSQRIWMKRLRTLDILCYIKEYEKHKLDSAEGCGALWQGSVTSDRSTAC